MRQSVAVVLTALLIATLVYVIPKFSPTSAKKTADSESQVARGQAQRRAEFESIARAILNEAGQGKLPASLGGRTALKSKEAIQLVGAPARGIRISDFPRERLSAQPFLTAQMEAGRVLVAFLDGSVSNLSQSELDGLLRVDNTRVKQAEAVKTSVPTDPSSSAPTDPSSSASATPSSGRYFVVVSSFSKSKVSEAENRRTQAVRYGLPVTVVITDDYPNLASGLRAVVLGPYSKGDAEVALRSARRFYADAYIKAGW